MSTHAISDREVARVPARQWDSDLDQGTETTLERRSHGEQYSAEPLAGGHLRRDGHGQSRRIALAAGTGPDPGAGRFARPNEFRPEVFNYLRHAALDPVRRADSFREPRLPLVVSAGDRGARGLAGRAAGRAGSVLRPGAVACG